MKKRVITLFVLAIGFSMFLYAAASTSVSGQSKDKNVRGQKLYVEYCASCHGTDGKGGGPVASSLKTPLPDLTKIPLENGKFPALKIKNIISGEVTAPAHGTREMPVWGLYFRRLKDESNSVLNVYALTRYIESLQVKQ
jgi:mono/diheme cytochrome c family protein